MNLIFLAPSDRFETVATVLIGQAGRCADRTIDAQVGKRLIGMCWALMPTAEMVTAMRSAAEEQRIDDPDYPGLAEQLGVPATLRPEVCRAAEQPEEGGARASIRPSSEQPPGRTGHGVVAGMRMNRCNPCPGSFVHSLEEESNA